MLGKGGWSWGGGGERIRGDWHGMEGWDPHLGTAVLLPGKPSTPTPAPTDHTPMLEQLWNYLVILIVTSIN